MTHFAQAVVNRLPDEAAKLTTFGQTDVDQWGVVGAETVSTNHSVFGPDTSFLQAYCTGVPYDGETSLRLYYNSLQLQPDDDGNFMEVAFYAKMPSGGSIDVVVYDITSATPTQVSTSFNVAPSTPSANAVGLSDSSWSAYRSDPIRVEKGILASPRINVTIDFTPDQPGADVYFANPSVIGFMDHAVYSEAVKNIIPNIPAALLEYDGESNPPGAITRFIDVMYGGLDVAAKALINYRYFTLEDGRDETNDATLSNLVWPSNAEFVEARWLAQFSGTEPIAKLSSAIEPSDPFVLDTSTLNGDDTLRFSSTTTVAIPEATTDVVTDFLQWQAEYGYYGIRAGTITAITEAVKRVMVGTKQVNVTLQHEGPFTVLIETPWEETYGGAVDLIGQSSIVAVEAISYAKPIGVKVTHRMF